MKPQVKILGLLIASVVSASAFADSEISKPTTRIDFNKMIDKNNHEKNDLQKSVAGKEEPMDSEVAADQRKAMDFIDIEMMQKNEGRPVVDRRFNSEGEPRVETAFSPGTEVELGGS